MIAAIILAAVTLAAASPAPAAQNQQVYKPLREVVYKVVANLQINDSSESYGGFNQGTLASGVDSSGTMGNYSASAPGSNGATGGTGTVTVDIMAVAADGTLGIRVTEQWTGVARPSSFDGAVSPDGTVEFQQSTIQDVTRELLSYFGTHFVPTDGLDTTTRWQTNQPYMNGNVTTDYSVSAVNGSIVTIQKKQAIKGFDVSTTGTIQYQAATLVPISGRVTRRMSSTLGNGGSEFQASSTTSRDRTLTLHFDLVSDSHAAAAAATH